MTVATLLVSSSHVARNVVSSILKTIGWNLKTRFDRNLQLDTTMMLPQKSWYLLQNQGLTRLLFRAKNLELHRSRTWVINVFQIVLENMSNKIENRYQWTKSDHSHLWDNIIGCCIQHKWMVQRWGRTWHTHLGWSILIAANPASRYRVVIMSFRGVQAIYWPRTVRFWTAFSWQPATAATASLHSILQ